MHCVLFLDFLFWMCSLPSPLLLFRTLHHSSPWVVVVYFCLASFLALHCYCLLCCVIFRLTLLLFLVVHHPLPCAAIVYFGSLFSPCAIIVWCGLFPCAIVVCCDPSPCATTHYVSSPSPCVVATCCGVSPSPCVIAIHCDLLLLAWHCCFIITHIFQVFTSPFFVLLLLVMVCCSLPSIACLLRWCTSPLSFHVLVLELWVGGVAFKK
jgi:hypothetical protein